MKTVDARQVVFKLWGDGGHMLFWCRAIFDFPVRPLAQTCVGMCDRACVSVINCNKLLQSRNVEQISRVFAACMFKPKCTSSCAAMKCSTCTSFFFFFPWRLPWSLLPRSLHRSLSLSSPFFPPPSLPCHPSSLHSLNLSFEVICEAPLCSPSGVPFLRSKCLKSFYKAGLCWNRLHAFCWHFDSLSQGRGESLTFPHFIELQNILWVIFLSSMWREGGERI